tara:strand:- start:209 stop:1048 length:840 start_codon:yes stop_codon:yes gene_type:complete
MPYFRQFPTVGYDFNRDGIIQNVVDIFRHARPLQNFVDEINTYRKFTIPDGQRPDICSQKLYGTPDYYWTFFILNDFLHDGMSTWPMSQQDLFQYIETEYNGVAIETRPNIVRNTDGGIVDFRNSLAGRFQVGETITGGTSFATGTLTKKDIYLNQLIVQDVTGTFLGDGVGNSLEAIIGSTSTDSVASWKVYDYAEAPHHWFVSGDEEEIQVSNANFFSTTDDVNTNLILQEGSVAAPVFTSNRNYLFDLNESRSKINIIDPNYIERFADTFEELVNA